MLARDQMGEHGAEIQSGDHLVGGFPGAKLLYDIMMQWTRSLSSLRTGTKLMESNKTVHVAPLTIIWGVEEEKNKRGSRCKSQVSRLRAQGSKLRDQGSGLQVQGQNFLVRNFHSLPSLTSITE